MNATNRQLWRLNEEGQLTLAPNAAPPITREEAKAALSALLNPPNTEDPDLELPVASG